MNTQFPSNRFHWRKIFSPLLVLFLGGCLGYPNTIHPVSGFEVERYLGTWYEIARLDHSFERGLQRVSAEYSLRDDGGITVVNRGYSPEKQRWQEATGKAYFVEDSGTGYLKVSFFGPFYGSYVIFELDKENYQYAFIAGPDNSYLWLLSGTTAPDKQLLDHFINQAREAGFLTEELIFVDHQVN